MYIYGEYIDKSILYFLGTFIIFVITMVLIVLVLQLIGMWKVMKKAGKPGWAAIIPIYNQYIMCEITGISPWWLVILYCGTMVFSFLGPLAMLFSLFCLYYTVLLSVSMARSFGKDDGFAVGLVLLAPIFYLVLGCSKDKYLGPKPMHDILFDKSNNNNNQTNKTKEESKNIKYCPKCGTKLNKDVSFCSNCGEKQ